MSSSSSSSSSAPAGPSLIMRLMRRLMVERGKHCFRDWFTEEEILSFRTSANVEGLFERYQRKMEASLTAFAHEEDAGLETPEDIVRALERARDETDEYRQLDKLVNSIGRREVFFKMMRRRADRLWEKREQSMARLRDGSGGGGGALSQRK